MFGLLKHKKLNEEEYSDFRLNYCGTCKTIGKLYGHKERVLLNFDVVFLSELLAAVNNRKEDFNYIKPYTCLTLPKKDEQIPQFLKYAASVNILLGHYKIIDNVHDSKHKYNIWSLMQYFGNSNFKKAEKYLAKQNLPIEFIDNEIQEQFKREKQKISFANYQDTFRYYCNQTAKITGVVFEHGVASFNDQQLSKSFSEIGTNFGEMVYLIDAIDDYEKDKKNGKFNFFLLHHTVDKTKLIEKVTKYIYECLEKTKSCINALPIKESKKRAFINSLYLNVTSKISPEKSCLTLKHCAQKSLSVKERYQLAILASKKIALNKKGVVLQYSSFAFLAVSLILLFIFFPHLVYSASDSAHKTDCCNDCGKINYGPCGSCCGFFCDGCISKCCGSDGSGGACSSGHFCRDMADENPAAAFCLTILCCVWCKGGGLGDCLSNCSCNCEKGS